MQGLILLFDELVDDAIIVDSKKHQMFRMMKIYENPEACFPAQTPSSSTIRGTKKRNLHIDFVKLVDLMID